MENIAILVLLVILAAVAGGYIISAFIRWLRMDDR